MNRAQQFWNKQAERFNNSQKQFEPGSQEIISRTKEYLDASDTVLDFGCATGIKTLELARMVKHIHGLDFSAGMISEAMKNKEKANVSNADFSVGTIFDNDLTESSFGKIIAYSIIHLLEDSQKAVQRINELLKPGGLFIAETACFSNKMNFKTRLEFSIVFFMKRLGVFPLHLNMFTSDDLETLIKNHDFSIVKSEVLFLNGMTISFIVAEKR